MEWKNCPCCGARLPEEISFCPHCAKSVNNRKEIHPPRRLSRQTVCVLLIFLAVLVLALAAWRCTQPGVYDDGGAATVTYCANKKSEWVMFPQNVIRTSADNYAV